MRHKSGYTDIGAAPDLEEALGHVDAHHGGGAAHAGEVEGQDVLAEAEAVDQHGRHAGVRRVAGAGHNHRVDLRQRSSASGMPTGRFCVLQDCPNLTITQQVWEQSQAIARRMQSGVIELCPYKQAASGCMACMPGNPYLRRAGVGLPQQIPHDVVQHHLSLLLGIGRSGLDMAAALALQQLPQACTADESLKQWHLQLLSLYFPGEANSGPCSCPGTAMFSLHRVFDDRVVILEC